MEGAETKILMGFHVFGPLIGLFLLLGILALLMWTGWRIIKWLVKT
ncbi:hypothetical protein OCC_14350 [Thermococcus litoralis DSM 5473]|uniref:Uncharacterized protein n=1 Tax=Thermococcus litoralis (strain ATCC 51850 / DSM 5473 / JCM 8560 / NS-C) TaxID=523849 RepID=S6A4M4_THELN|nr:hypothetical protein OCC_14350 [Thermococcus litoralis DSM 5473]